VSEGTFHAFQPFSTVLLRTSEYSIQLQSVLELTHETRHKRLQSWYLLRLRTQDTNYYRSSSILKILRALYHSVIYSESAIGVVTLNWTRASVLEYSYIICDESTKTPTVAVGTILNSKQPNLYTNWSTVNRSTILIIK
jgi:hypothetical protein